MTGMPEDWVPSTRFAECLWIQACDAYSLLQIYVANGIDAGANRRARGAERGDVCAQLPSLREGHGQAHGQAGRQRGRGVLGLHWLPGLPGHTTDSLADARLVPGCADQPVNFQKNRSNGFSEALNCVGTNRPPLRSARTAL